MDLNIIKDIPVEIDEEKLARKLRISKGGTAMAERFHRLVQEAIGIARPKGAYRPVGFDLQGDDGIVIDGVLLTSRVLAFHLKEIHRVFPFVVTCGREVADWANMQTEVLERFWLEAVLDSILMGAITRTGEQIVSSHALGKTAVMTPGSLPDWPIQEQKQLFTILGDVETAIGVRLRDSFMMDPRQSVSGILFTTEIDFQTCMLCPQEGCPKRRAAHDPDLYEQRYRKK
jgi:hypothetical protein